MGTPPHIDDSERLAVNAAGVGRLLGISQRSVWKQLAAGRLPRPIALGRSKRWRVAEIEAWLAAGAPPNDKWEAMKEEGLHGR